MRDVSANVSCWHYLLSYNRYLSHIAGLGRQLCTQPQIPGTEQTGMASERRAFICLLRKASACGFPSFLLKTSRSHPAAFMRVGKFFWLTVRRVLKGVQGKLQFCCCCENRSVICAPLVVAVLVPGRQGCHCKGLLPRVRTCTFGKFGKNTEDIGGLASRQMKNVAQHCSPEAVSTSTECRMRAHHCHHWTLDQLYRKTKINILIRSYNSVCA